MFNLSPSGSSPKNESSPNAASPSSSPNCMPDALSGLSEAASQSHLERATDSTPFDKILNFRDLSDGDTDRLNKGKIFRCGLIHMATDQDFKVLTETYGIKTTIDLRSSDEIRQSPSPLYEKYFPTDRTRLGRTRCRVQCPLWRVSMNFKMLLDAKKYSTFGSMALSFATLQIDTGIKHLVSEMNEVKLLGMYKCFLRYFQPQIKEALEVLSDPNNYPIMFHCSLGKDRTGTMASLVSSIVGMDRATIVSEYAKSEQNLAPVKEEIVEKLKRFHLEDWLADSPPEVMEDTFKFIDETWGSTEGFFKEIGFSTASQIRLYDIMNKRNSGL